tara:strand:+ start:4029 stop:4886 length:858 start_codon:yes stop_codon:yes gene_type:complete
MTELQFADIQGVRIAYEQKGRGKLPLLALHGFPRTHRTWLLLEPFLADYFHLIMPDRRGYGDSERVMDSSSYSLENMTSDAIGLMDYLGIDNFVVIGHDKGSPTARKIAFDYPERVLAMVQIDSTPQELNDGSRDPSGRQWYFDFFRQRNVAEKITTAIPELFFGLFIDRNPHLPDSERQFYVDQFSKPGTPEAVVWDYRLMLEKDPEYWRELTESGRKIIAPTLVLWGNIGPSANAPVLEQWRQVADNVTGMPVEMAAHYVHEQQPEITAKHILNFMRDINLLK